MTNPAPASEPPMTHGMNCQALIPGNDEECTCGLRWRIALQTEQAMHVAWRKRANESEAECDALQAQVRSLTSDIMADRAEIERVRGERDVLDQAFGNILARIFRDGGHRQHQIGDVTRASEEAERVVLEERTERDDLAARLAKAEKYIDEIHRSIDDGDTVWSVENPDAEETLNDAHEAWQAARTALETQKNKETP